jgi:Rha family phage regulatory protein
MKNEIAVVNPVEQRAKEIMARIKVFDRGGEFWTDSLSVAEAFGKRHDNLIQAIKRIDEENQAVSLLSFKEAEYIDAQGKARPYFEMTETGFASVVGSFNDQKGTDIALIKAMYRKEFDRLKKEERDGLIRYRVPEELQSLLAGLIISHNKFCDSVSEWKSDVKNDQKETTKVIDFIGKKVDTLEVKVVGFEQKLDNLVKISERRKDVRASDMRTHIQYLYDQYDGKCPVCRSICIIDSHKQPVQGVFEMDHHYKKTRNKLDETWPVCKQCNSKFENGGYERVNIEGMFAGYQGGLKEWKKKIKLLTQNTFGF